MNIVIQTWGFEGRVRPFLALAAGLRAAGHDVTLAVTHVMIDVDVHNARLLDIKD
jgi:sterol 3beta-glucosyltransferase